MRVRVDGRAREQSLEVNYHLGRIVDVLGNFRGLVVLTTTWKSDVDVVQMINNATYSRASRAFGDLLVLGENPLDFLPVGGAVFAKGQLQQDSCLLRRKRIGGYDSKLRPALL